MDLLIVARETDGAPPSQGEITDPMQARAALSNLPHGPLVAELVARLSIGTLVLARSLDRGAARSALGVAMQRSKPRGVVLLGLEFGRELFGEGLQLTGGIRVMYSRPVGVLGQAKPPEIEKLLADLCQRAGVPWAPPSTRAAPARAVVRAEEVEALAAALIERQQWQQAVDTLHQGEPLGPRGTNMLGRALIELKDHEGARQAFERTLAADPGNAIAQRQLARLSGG